MTTKFSRTEIATAAALCLAALSLPLQAQTAANPAPNLDTVVITGIRASIGKSIDTKRNADTNVEVVSAEDVGKMPDKNIADALSRLAGVNVQYGGAGALDEAERVSIRGTSPNLNLVTVNGHALSSGDWHVGDQSASGRSVGFGLMPSELIGQAIVYKSGRADITEGGIAGSVDILMRKPLDFKKGVTGEVSLGAVYATLPGKTDPQASGLINWRNDDGTLGFLVQAFQENRHLRRDGQEVFSYGVITPAQAAASGDPSLAGKRMPGSLNAAEFEGERERSGGYIGVQVKPNQSLEVNFSAFRANLKADNYNSSGYAMPTTMVANGWLIKNAKVNGNVITSADIVRPAFVAGNSAAAQADLDKRVIGFEYDNIDREGAKSLSSFTDLDVTYKPSDKLSVRARLGYTVGSGLTNSEPMLTYGLINPNMSYAINGSSPTRYTVTDLKGNAIDMSKIANFSQMSNTAAAVESLDQEHYAHLDFDYKPDWALFSSVKWGLRKSTHDRTYNAYSGRWNGQDTATGAVTPSPFISVVGGLLVNKDTLPVYTNGVLTTTPVATANLVPGILSPANTYPANWGAGLNAGIPYNLFRFDAAQIQAFAAQYMNWDPVLNKTWTSGYFIEEGNTAAYLVGEFEAGPKLSGNLGLRFVQTKLQSVSYQALPSGTGTGQCVPLQPCSVPNAIVGSRFATYIPQVVDTTNNTLLPSLNLRYELERDIIVRAAIGRTMGRANYNELAGAVALNGTTLTGSSGNPNLKPITSNNFDASVAWYFAPRAYVSGGVFAQSLHDYVKAGTSQVEYFNTVTGQNAIFTVSSRRGVDASLHGAEAALELPVGKGFGFGANATYVNSSDADGVEMLGTSKWTYNLRGFYEDDKFSASLAWNYRTDYATGFVGNGSNTPLVDANGIVTQYNGLTKYKGYGALSLSLGYRLTNDLSIHFDGNNLNDPVRSTYSVAENAPANFYRSGRQYFVSLHAKF
jgi:iron complex outermembrane receptor protein